MPKQKFTSPKDYLNQIVKVKIDHPLNSKHDKFDMTEEANYGFVPNTLAPDREELDAYVLGVDKPLVEFTGKCLAIIHRTNDNDDKLIIVPEDFEISDEKIKKQIHYREKWFKSIIIRR